MKIIGHQKIRDFFVRAIKKGNLSHAYIFQGPDHLGKFTFALELARELANSSGETINPDIVIMAPQIEEKKGIIRKKEMTVENVRELIRKLGMTSFGSNWRVAIIDEADYLTRSAQNALLKILEEPPTKSIIVLVTGRSNVLLPTIRSRCQTKRFAPVSDGEIRKIIPPESKDQDEIVFWSLGCPGLARMMVSDRQELQKRKDVLGEVKKILSGNMAERFDIAESIAKDGAALSEKMILWAVVMREMMTGKRNIGIAIKPEKALNNLEKIEKNISLLRETNSNPRLVLENLFLEF